MNRVLIIEEAASQRAAYAGLLTGAGHRVTEAGSLAQGLAACRAAAPDVILLDLCLSDGDGFGLLVECLSIRPRSHLVVIATDANLDRAIEALRLGAFDFIVKPFSDAKLLKSIANACEDAARGGFLPDDDGARSTGPATELIGSSPAMREVRRVLNSVANSMAAVFLTGEDGTGKALCARAVHAMSRRAKGPFVAVNCAALPGPDPVAELFGATTADGGRLPGAIAGAEGGTLFLEEITAAPMEVQTALLSFLQTARRDVAEAAAASAANVRLICSAGTDPYQAVRQGDFRADLFFRLHVVPIHLPPLRDRGRDALEIARVALPRIAREEGRRMATLSPAAGEILLAQDWPGNVRQLLNLLRSVVVLNSAPVITPEMLPPAMLQGGSTPVSAADEDGDTAAAAAASPESVLEGLTLAQIERIAIEGAIERHNGSVARAAHELDVSASTLYRRRECWARETGEG